MIIRATENSEEQENKNCKREQYLNELQEHNYDLFSKKRKSRKKYIHSAHCVVMKEPIDINTLKTFSEEENYISNSNLDTHISLECTANQILTESLSSPEEYKILKEKLKMAEKGRDILKSKVNDLGKNIDKNIPK